MSICFNGYNYLDNDSFIDCQEQATVLVKRGYVWNKNSYISSTVIYLAYNFFH